MDHQLKNRRGSSYQLWLGIFVVLGLFGYLATLGYPVGVNGTDGSGVLEQGINSSEDSAWYDSAYNFYDTVIGTTIK